MSVDAKKWSKLRSKKGTARARALNAKIQSAVTDQEKQVEFMTKVDHWSRWPLLPMKRHDERGQLATVGFLVTGKGPVIHRGSMYSVEPGARWDSFSREMYESFDALYLAGWRID